MLVAFVFAFFVSMAISGLVCLFVRRNASRIGLVDRPGERKIHDEPIPTGGGLGIGLGVMSTFAICQLVLYLALNVPAFQPLFQETLPESLQVHLAGAWSRCRELWCFLGLGSVLLLLGTFDDRFNLNWKLRLTVQTIVALLAVCAGWRLTFYIDSPILTGAISVLWIVGLINSFNLLDNMNGLSGGVAAICAIFLTIAMFFSPNPLSHQPQFFVGGFLIVLMGAIFGFLLFNNPFRATMFMGNGGAYFIGFLLAASTLTATFSGYDRAPQTVFVPLLILAVPLYDTITVLVIRLKNGKSPFVGDKNHFSHRLVELGLSRTQAVLTIYLTTTICCLGAVLLYKVDFFGACLIFLQVFLVLLLIGIMEFAARKREQNLKNR